MRGEARVVSDETRDTAKAKVWRSRGSKVAASSCYRRALRLSKQGNLVDMVNVKSKAE